MAPDLHDTGSQSAESTGAMRAMALRAAGLPSGPGPHWIDARLLCRAAVHEVAPRARQQRVGVKLSLPDEPAVVIGFAPLLLKALDLVIANAMRAMRDGGTLTLRVYRDPFVVIECCDTGSPAAGSGGRQDADLDHLTRSWRAEDLAGARPDPARAAARIEAAKDIVQAHRGCLWVRPSDAGTSVIFELPAAGPSAPNRPWRRRTG